MEQKYPLSKVVFWKVVFAFHISYCCSFELSDHWVRFTFIYLLKKSFSHSSAIRVCHIQKSKEMFFDHSAAFSHLSCFLQKQI